jgi:hypothetical protein
MDNQKRNDLLLNHLRTKLQYQFPDLFVKSVIVNQLKKQQMIVIDIHQKKLLKQESQKELEQQLLNQVHKAFHGFAIHRSQFSDGLIKIVLYKKLFDFSV